MNNSNVTVYTSYPVNQIIKKRKNPESKRKEEREGGEDVIEKCMEE